jgi:hypothetical protein
MSHVSTNDISKNLHQSRLRFHDPKHISIGTGQSYEYRGLGKGVTFDVEGTQHAAPVNFANAHLEIDQGQKFVGSIKLGDAADVKLDSLHATSYLFDEGRGDLKLFQGNTLVDDLKLDTGGRSIAVANFPETSATHGGVLISTGRFRLGEGIDFAIPPVHT